MDIRYREKGKGTEMYCWVSEKVCRDKRVEVRKLRLGKTTKCSTQAIAYCLQTVETPIMVRQVMCTRTPENCEYVREMILQGVHPSNYVTECQPRRNDDPFDKPKGFEPQDIEQ